MNAVATPTQLQPSLLDLFQGPERIRADISNEDYHADRSCVSVSGLKKLLRSPAHFRHSQITVHNETPAMFFGTALHTAVLEPERFASDYVIAPPDNKNTKTYKTFVEENADKLILSAALKEQIDAMVSVIYAHGSARTLIRAGLKEHTIIWRDEETGIWLKIRPDNLVMDFGRAICLDLKSCEDASPEAFARNCVNYDYDLQAAVYLNGIRSALETDAEFAFLASEKEAPHGCALYGAPEKMLVRGERRFREALQTLKRCRETDRWDCYQPAGDYSMLDWPRWAA